jgi:membrane protease YdiL (CAAX protease family)
VVRAVLVGLLVATVGGIMTGPLIYANLELWPAVPWSVPLLAAWLWVFWRYLNGRGWPRSTAEARRRGLRARPLSLRVWRLALAAGFLAMGSSFALHWVVGRFVTFGYGIPEPLVPFPFFTLLSILLVLSLAAGVVEESAFRGYMQGPIERRHGIVVAILVVSVVFGLGHLTDWQPAMTLARMFFIVTAAVLYGILVHLTDSIRPGIVLHAVGDAIGICWIWWIAARRGAGPDEAVVAAASDPVFWGTCLAVVGLGSAAAWAFVRLARLTADELYPADLTDR